MEHAEKGAEAVYGRIQDKSRQRNTQGRKERGAVGS